MKLIFAIALILVGCATGSTRVDLSKIDAPPPGTAKIFVIRPNHQFGRIIDLPVTANATKIAVLKNLSYTSFLMAPGKLKLSGDGTASSWPHKEITLDVAEGQTYYTAWDLVDSNFIYLVPIVGWAIDMNSIHWQLLTKEDAQELLNSTNYVAPTVEEIPE